VKPIKVENEDLKRAVKLGEPYIQIDNRNFLLIEVDQIREPNVYEVTDPKEEKQLLKALERNNPIMSDGDIDKMFSDQK
jgi:indole-3-glycerol phosphate synthase